MRIPFVGPSYTARSPNFEAQRSLNLYLEPTEAGAGVDGNILILTSAPGLRTFASHADGSVRGLYTASTGTLYAVIAGEVFAVSQFGALSELGTLGTLAGPVSMDDNGTELLIVDGASGYIVTLTDGSFAQVADPDFPPNPSSVAFLDGYFVVSEGESGRFHISGLYDGTAWDGLDFATAEGAPDNVTRAIRNRRELWFFGRSSTEIFYNSGNADFPFERIPGAVLEIGCAAPRSVARAANTLLWLSADENGFGQVVQAQGYEAQRVSTNAVETAIQSYGNLEDATAWTYQDGGHIFYVLNFTGANTTWVYDLATLQWHERAWRAGDGYLSRHRADNHAFAYGRHFVGDYDTGTIYQMSQDFVTDAGNPILRLRRAQHINNDGLYARYHSFELLMETGVGLDGMQQGDDPQVMLRWSDDGGHKWSNEHWAPLGRIGRREQRVRWRRLGKARDRVFEMRMTDPVKCVLFGARGDVTLSAA